MFHSLPAYLKLR